MAIFGAVSIWYPSETENGTCFPNYTEGILYCKQRTRDVNDWDVFLNYFFAVLFVICFIVGVISDPLIILYHSKQKTTFAKVLFLLISVIDLIRSIYFPLVLVPKLLSPIRFSETSTHEDLDYEGDLYFYIPETTVYWTYHANTIVALILDFQQEILVTLCVCRYFTIKDPLSSAKKRIFALCFLVAASFIGNAFGLFLEYYQESFGCITILDTVIPLGESGHSKDYLTLAFTIGNVLRCTALLIGGVFSGLTILHLKKSDTAACKSSEKNVRKGIIAIVAMNVFNIFVIIFAVYNSILYNGLSKELGNHEEDLYEGLSTWRDFLLFAGFYGITLTQSAFNTLSFLFICRSFRDFVKRLLPTRIGRVDIRQTSTANRNLEIETTVM